MLTHIPDKLNKLAAVVWSNRTEIVIFGLASLKAGVVAASIIHVLALSHPAQAVLVSLLIMVLELKPWSVKGDEPRERKLNLQLTILGTAMTTVLCLLVHVLGGSPTLMGFLGVTISVATICVIYLRDLNR